MKQDLERPASLVLRYDGLLLTNGPGDPERCRQVVDQLERLVDDPRPIFGICLGCRLLGLAAGGRTFKLPYGHRGQNQPVVDAFNDDIRSLRRDQGQR